MREVGARFYGLYGIPVPKHQTFRVFGHGVHEVVAPFAERLRREPLLCGVSGEIPREAVTFFGESVGFTPQSCRKAMLSCTCTTIGAPRCGTQSPCGELELL